MSERPLVTIVIPTCERLELLDIAVGVLSRSGSGDRRHRGRRWLDAAGAAALDPRLLVVRGETRRSVLPPPVAATSAIEVIESGRVKDVQLPVTSARGGHFGLADKPPGRTVGTKGDVTLAGRASSGS